MSDALWTTDEALALCFRIERICPQFGCHVALTGGCLYKGGPRKDLDLVFYRIRQVPKIDVKNLFITLDSALGIRPRTSLDDWRFVIKAEWGGKSIDFLFPESSQGGYYPEEPKEKE